MATTQAVKYGSDDKAAPTAAIREVKPVPRTAITMEWAGQTKKMVRVALPEGTTFQDLNDHPEMWREVQGSLDPAISLRVNDDLEMHTWDGRLKITATVGAIDRGKVVLYDYRKAEKPGRIDALYEDDLYRCEWRGLQVGVIRKRDGILMGGMTYGTPEAARAALMSLYPKRAVA